MSGSGNHSWDFPVCRGDTFQYLRKLSESGLGFGGNGYQVLDLLPRGTEAGTTDLGMGLAKSKPQKRKCR